MLIVRAQSWNPLVDDERIPFSLIVPMSAWIYNISCVGMDKAVTAATALGGAASRQITRPRRGTTSRCLAVSPV